MTLPRLEALTSGWQRWPPANLVMMQIARRLGVDPAPNAAGRSSAGQMGSMDDLVQELGGDAAGFTLERMPEWLKTKTE